MSWPRVAAFGAMLSFTVPPSVEPAPEEPLPLGAPLPDGPLADTWTRKSATVPGLRVRLNGLGVRTHANWVLFRVPFDTTQRQRLRNVRFTASSDARTDVGMVRFGGFCLDIPSSGDVANWSFYTVSGIGSTERYRWHPVAPTDDPTVLGINVPTRVANYAACTHGSESLHDPARWHLTIEWEER